MRSLIYNIINTKIRNCKCESLGLKPADCNCLAPRWKYKLWSWAFDMSYSARKPKSLMDKNLCLGTRLYLKYQWRWAFKWHIRKQAKMRRSYAKSGAA